MAVERTTSESVIELDRKISRALQHGRGISLSPVQLDVLADIGLVSRLAEEKARILQEQAKWRQKRVASINGESSGLTLPEGQGENPPLPTGISGGMMPPPDASAGRRRARQTFD